MYVLPASSSVSWVNCYRQNLPAAPNTFHHHVPMFITGSIYWIRIISHLISYVSLQPQPSKPPKIPVVGGTTCRRGLLWLREPLAIGDGTTTSGSPGRKWWQNWIQKDKWYCDMGIIWGIFWNCWDDFGDNLTDAMILWVDSTVVRSVLVYFSYESIMIWYEKTWYGMTWHNLDTSPTPHGATSSQLSPDFKPRSGANHWSQTTQHGKQKCPDHYVCVASHPFVRTFIWFIYTFITQTAQHSEVLKKL